LSAPDDALIVQHLQALAVITMEGLESMEFNRFHIESIATCYAVLGNSREFVVWARKAAQLRPESHWSQYVVTPQAMPIWGRRAMEKARHSRK
jgi:hypothetical protein